MPECEAVINSDSTRDRFPVQVAGYAAPEGRPMVIHGAVLLVHGDPEASVLMIAMGSAKIVRIR